MTEGISGIGTGLPASLTIGNSAVGTTLGQYNGILQLNGADTNDAPPNTILHAVGDNRVLTIVRNINPANADNADMAIRINTNNSIIQFAQNATIDIQTQLVMTNNTERRIIVQGNGTLKLQADNAQGYTAAYGQGTYVGLQGGFTVQDSGRLSVAADNNLGVISALDADNLILNNGTLLARESFVLNTNRGITLGAGGGTVSVATDKTLTYDGIITGSGNFTKSGAGTLVLGSVNTYSGTTTLNAGTLLLSGAGQLPSSTTINLNNANGAVLDLNGHNQTVSMLTGGGTSGGNVNLGTGTLTLNPSTTNTYSGVISGDGAIVKQNTGDLILRGVNTYTGGTSIEGGRVTIGVANALPDSGTITIKNGGTLSTAGGISGPVGFSDAVGTLKTEAGSRIELGTGVHTLTFTGLDSDSAGTLTIDGWTGSKFTPGTQGRLLFTGLGTDPNAQYAAWLATVNFTGAEAVGGFFIDTGVSGQFELVPVPEPGTVTGIAAAGLAGFGLVRRRLRKGTPAVAV